MQSRAVLVSKVLAIFSLFYSIYILTFSNWSFVGQHTQVVAENELGSHPLETTVLSWNPLIIYIRNFITEDERRYFLSLSDGHFRQSEIFVPGQDPWLDKSLRDSSYFELQDADPTAQNIFARLRVIEGNFSNTYIEKTRIQRYTRDGHFTYHSDAEEDDIALTRNGNRVSTLMIYLEANDALEGGGTHFPFIEIQSNPADKCTIMECYGEKNGTIFLPVVGNALFWTNLDTNGRQHPQMIHAGLPVHAGTKTISNIWLWQKWPSGAPWT
ncbi:prolyl 4-hydroxylase alpha subunit, putative [Talaromyces stipitatus ATCC 10500]|uniref:Prolyl 4-hydroxylase alpha subunit, putative n=1 Tax=Talaromyces stipitatus (strain ATCC 10500 / CBS 375.48 / QM 6759 / NRRL 1006) TaxID=441959 RepID=B8M0F6_TALSN|nr:prolyl 4-hydroxylase alpha subunit, putative [Talaromyces stipitatus ATCC 10500]EED21253.1 prolyl 4-hydroxylase alpha subunit, putative [Talaromyces stipitatus ATCC 10500]